MNVIDVDAAPLHEVVERVRAEAAAHGVEVAAASSSGLVPERVVAGAAAQCRRRSFPGSTSRSVLETRAPL